VDTTTFQTLTERLTKVDNNIEFLNLDFVGL